MCPSELENCLETLKKITWKMNDVVDEESRFDEGDCDHEEGRRVAGELLRVGEGAHDALQRRRLLRRQSVLPDCLKKVLQEKEPQGS